MRRIHIFLLTIITALTFSTGVSAQKIRGVVTDSLTNEPLLYVTVQYEGKGSGSVTNGDGEYEVDNHARRGWTELTFSAIGYETKKVKITTATRELTLKLKPADIQIAEVTVRPGRERYRRRENPAVIFMRKVIEKKKGLKLETNDYYEYRKYQKMRMSINDITPEKMEKGIYKKFSFFKDQMEESAKTGKTILPISIKETASRTIYRKSPESKKEIIDGFNSSGIEEFFNTGDLVGTILSDVFKDINIYDDDINLLQRRFVSPIGRGAITFYQYYLEDTLMVDKTECIHLTFVPANPMDPGFTGHLYVARDSSYAVKRCIMNLPKKTAVNFVEDMIVQQEYEQMPDSSWVLMNDDMTVPLKLASAIQGLEVERTTRYSDYKFDPIEPRLFRLKGDVIKEIDMMNKTDEFWAEVRNEPLTKQESTMDLFMNRLEQIPGFKFAIFALKALIENYIELGDRHHPSKVDLGPINTIVTSNFVNGLRLRLSAGTTANLSKHWFFEGYGAYGFKDHKWMYKGQVAYSFLPRQYMLWEFPKHYIQFKYQYDVMSPSDKYLDTDKDNMFVGLRWTTMDQMMYSRNAELTYELETQSGLSIKAQARHRNDEPVGTLAYYKNDGPVPGVLSEQNTFVKDVTTNELAVTLRYAPGESFINTKQRRRPISLDAPIYTLTHTFGFKGLGGDYNFNITEFSMRKRFWFGSWGHLNIIGRAGAQWNKVPFPMLNIPIANLSYIMMYDQESFGLIKNMEFLNDRYAALFVKYNMNGKLFNRIPLIKKLKWREMFCVRAMWGTLTDKNNPYLPGNEDLFVFPMRNGQPASFLMDTKKPYVEVSFGIYNIFKLLHVEYVRRLTYLDAPGTHKDGFRFMVLMTF
jgi:hypothetical protein